jgi:hyaluronoglucosaminidase
MVSILAVILAILIGTSAYVTSEPAHAAPSGAKILPTPQQQSARGVTFSLTGRVNVVVGAQVDRPARTLLADVVKKSGGKAVFVPRADGHAPTIYLGTLSDNPAIARILYSIGVSNASKLPAEGYVVASGLVANRSVLVLNGHDAAGTYYAAQSLSQAVAGGEVAPLRIRDWPLLPTRGVIEGFYGIPWTQHAIIDQLAFYGRHKLNTFVYEPKDDPSIRSNWRHVYSPAELAKVKALVDQAKAHHVTFAYGLSPAQDICYSSDADLESTIARFVQLRSIGVTAFYVGLDDVPYQLSCPSDHDRFTRSSDDPTTGFADAQAYYLNRIVSEYIAPNDLGSLQTVLTDYAGSDASPYRQEIAQQLDESIGIQWTGEGVFADTTTAGEAARAAATYKADHLSIWDNFPVNDGQPGRLFLNPLEGRDPKLYQVVDGILANPMAQPYASMVALAQYGDYDWNGPKYIADVSQSAIIAELAGMDSTVRTALSVFVDLNQNWQPYRSPSRSAPALSADIRDFWSGYDKGDKARMRALEQRLATIAALPSTLRKMSQRGFFADARPWIDAAASWATATQHEIKMLAAIRRDDGGVATDAMLAGLRDTAKSALPTVPELSTVDTVERNAIVPTVGDGAFETFFNQSKSRYNAWLGAKSAAYPTTASSDLSAYKNHGLQKMLDGDRATWYSSSEAPGTGSAVTVDLGSSVPIGSVEIHQSTSDATPGDMLYHAQMRYSDDGTTWIDAGSFDAAPLISQDFSTPISARFVQLIATAPNPNDEWVRIRDFAVWGPKSELHSSLRNTPGHDAQNAFDASVATTFIANEEPGPESDLTRTLSPTKHINSITFVGRAQGRVEVKTASGWHGIGQLAPDDSFQQFALDDTQISAARIVFTPGSAAPIVNELDFRDSREPISAPSSSPGICIGAWVVAGFTAVVCVVLWLTRKRVKNRGGTNSLAEPPLS